MNNKHEIKLLSEEKQNSLVDSISGEFSEKTEIIEEPVIKTFDEMELSSDLLRGIYGYGFEFPSPIQMRAILPITKGRDVIAQAQSGTGKTAAFAIGSLNKINTKLAAVQTLVMAPTRELAGQIAAVFTFLSEFMGIKVHLLTGGTRVKEDINKLNEGVHVVVGTSGRVLDLIEKKILNLADLNTLILDEADEMLSKGFLENFKNLVTFIPPSTNILLFSATMTNDVVALTDHFMEKPVKILVPNEELTLDGITQYFVMLKKEDKLDVLLQIYRGIEIAQAIIYCNSKNSVDFVSDELAKKGYMVSSTHSGKSQMERDLIMKDFRSGATRVLITTDLLSRGIDVYQVSLVINYELPREKETYIHRIGRSGRFGRKGTAINFVTPGEKDDFDNLQKHYNTTIEALPTDLSKVN